MKWRGRRGSDNVIDQRRFGGGSIGLGGLLIGALLYYLAGGNPAEYVARNVNTAPPAATSAASEEQKEFVSVVLADTEDVWNNIFQQSGAAYQEPKLILFNGQVRSACGTASSAVGPFYCPGDQRVYLDLSFFQQLSNSLGAGGDFASAYVIAHEVGHHVQNLLGVERNFRQMQAGLGESQRNKLSVQMELQADCLSGVWAKQTQATKGVLEQGDLEEAMNAASAVGDDRLQSRAQGQVVPDSFTHGSSAQRVQAFQTGFSTGQPQSCLNAYQVAGY